MASPKLTEASIRVGATEKSFARGRELFRRGAVSHTAIQGNTLSGTCEGTGSPFYKVRAELDDGGILSATCTCPYDFGGYCKHIVALLLSYAREPERFAIRKEPAELLSDLSREQLIALVTKLVSEQSDLSDRIEAALAAPSISGQLKTSSAKRRKVDVEVYRRRVRGIMHGLDHMRTSEAYWHVGGLVEELRGVERSAREFLDAGDAEAALRILLTLLEESHDGFEYIDDSNGELGDYLNGLGGSLAEVILSLDLSEEEREDLLSDLDDLNGSLSDYGIEGLSAAIMATQYGWGEIPKQGRRDEAENKDKDKRNEECDEDEEGMMEGDGDWYAPTWSPEDPMRGLMRAKLNVLERQGRTDEHLTLCLSAGEHLRYALKLLELGRLPEAVSHSLKRLTEAGDALMFAQHLRESDISTKRSVSASVDYAWPGAKQLSVSGSAQSKRDRDEPVRRSKLGSQPSVKRRLWTCGARSNGRPGRAGTSSSRKSWRPWRSSTTSSRSPKCSLRSKSGTRPSRSRTSTRKTIASRQWLPTRSSLTARVG